MRQAAHQVREAHQRGPVPDQSAILSPAAGSGAPAAGSCFSTTPLAREHRPQPQARRLAQRLASGQASQVRHRRAALGAPSFAASTTPSTRGAGAASLSGGGASPGQSSRAGRAPARRPK